MTEKTYFYIMNDQLELAIAHIEHLGNLAGELFPNDFVAINKKLNKIDNLLYELLELMNKTKEKEELE